MFVCLYITPIPRDVAAAEKEELKKRFEETEKSIVTKRLEKPKVKIWDLCCSCRSGGNIIFAVFITFHFTIVITLWDCSGDLLWRQLMYKHIQYFDLIGNKKIGSQKISTVGSTKSVERHPCLAPTPRFKKVTFLSFSIELFKKSS